MARTRREIENDEEDIDFDPVPEEEDIDKINAVNLAKSEGAKKMHLDKKSTNGLGLDRNTERFNYKCFDGLHLSSLQKEFIVKFMDPPYLGKKEFRYEVFKDVYNPGSDNAMRANCTKLLQKPKMKEAMKLYQIQSMKNHKTEVISESIENYRKRANYKMSTFYFPDGRPKPLSDIPEEWMICIDGIDRKLSTKNEKEIINYKMADKDKAVEKLHKLLDIDKEGEKISIEMSEGKKSIIEESEGTGNAGPRIVLNMSVGNPFKNEEK